MEYGRLNGLGKPVARLLQGTVMLTAENRDANFRLLDTLFEQGFNSFDTAHNYNDGDAERELGAWIKARGIRDEVLILTKGGHPYPGEPDRVRPHFIRQDLQESLERLQTDSVELYMLHRDSRETPVDELVDLLDEFQARAVVGVYGGSNWQADRVAAANAYAAAHGKTPFSISSPQFSIAEMLREPWPGCISVSGRQGEAQRAWYDANDIALLTWSSLAGGFMTGKFTRDNLASFSHYWDTTPIAAYAFESNFQRLDRCIALAQEKKLSPAQIAVAYVLSHNPQYFAIVSNWEVAQVAENAAAASLQLSAQEIAWLELKTPDRGA